MPYTTTYRGAWQSFNDEQTFAVYIYDTTSYTSDPVDIGYQELKITNIDMPSIDNDKDVFRPIRAKKCSISFLSNTNVKFTTFSQGSDRRFKVEVWIESVPGVTAYPVFEGYLVMEGAQAPFLPHPQVTTITATDNLATLKDIPLTKSDGTNPKGNYSLIQYVAWCLEKTNLSLNINVACNLFPEGFDGSTHGPFEYLYLDAKTFESEINISEDCFTVLSKILKGFGCYLSQHYDTWWIKSVNEHRYPTMRVYQYTSAGVFTSSATTGTNLTKVIRKGEDIYFRDASTIVNIDRPKKSVKLTYSYEFPKEIICNIDFSRGDYVSDLPDEVVNGITYNAKKYEIECWDYLKGFNEPYSTLDAEAYIERLFFNGYEKERFIIMPETPVNAFYSLRCAGRIPILFRDKFSIGCSFKYSADFSGSSVHQIEVRLYGDDGSHWTLAGDTSTGYTYWQLSDSTWSSNRKFISYNTDPSTTDLSQWQNFSIEAAPVPIDGELEVYLVNDDGSNARKKYYTDLSFDYMPFINGSYQKFTNEYHKFSNPSDDYKAKFEDQIFVWDGIRKLFKGALMTFDGEIYHLANSFYNYIEGTTGGFTLDRLGKYLTNDYWNQYRNEKRIFDASIQGIESEPDVAELPDLIHKYVLLDVSYESLNRYFLITSLSKMNPRDCSWQATLSEIYSVVPGYEFDNTKWEFKYS